MLDWLSISAVQRIWWSPASTWPRWPVVDVGGEAEGPVASHGAA